MAAKKHLVLFVIALAAWLSFYLIGYPSHYFQDWSLPEQTLLSLITVFGVVPVIGSLVLIFMGGDYVRTSLWFAFYASIPLSVVDYLVVGVIGGEGMGFLRTHWYVSMAYVYVWIELPLLGLGIRKLLHAKNSAR